jgi:hypothetical protein
MVSVTSANNLIGTNPPNRRVRLSRNLGEHLFGKNFLRSCRRKPNICSPESETPGSVEEVEKNNKKSVDK